MKKNNSLLDFISTLFTIGYYIGIFVLGGILLTSIVKIAFGMEGYPMKMDFLLDSFIELPASYKYYDGDQFSGSIQVGVSLHEFITHDLKYKLFGLFDQIITFGIGILHLKLIKDIFYSLSISKKKEEFFDIINYKRIRYIGFLLIGYIFYELTVSICFSVVFLEDFTLMDKTVNYMPEFSELGGLITAAVILIIAEVYKAGIELKEESELTV